MISIMITQFPFISRYTHYNGCGTPGGWHGRVLSEACASHQVHEVQVHPEEKGMVGGEKNADPQVGESTINQV